MCEPITLATALTGAGGLGATAAGAAASAATAAAVGGAATAGITGAAAATGAGILGAGALLQNIGTIASVGGSLASGFMQANAMRAQADQIKQQQATERQINAVEDQRFRSRFMSQIAQQNAELAARGVSLDSPTAALLGQYAGQELEYGSQSIRAGGEARDIELSAAEQQINSSATLSMFRGGFSAAGSLLNATPQLWPGLLS